MEMEVISKIGEFFQEYTKYQYFTEPSDMARNVPVPPAEKPVFSDQKIFSLPDGRKFLRQNTRPIFEIIDQRRSRRNFADKNLSMEQLAGLLWAIQGVKRAGAGYSLRTVPSAGARHPLETYIHANRIENLPKGLYRYQPLSHQLVLVSDQDISWELTAACLGQEMVSQCSAFFIWTAVIDRARWKYQQRGYRYIYLDAGHVCQNLYLASEAMNLGCCAIAAFDDDAMNKIIGVDGKEEFAIYMATVGYVA